MKPFPLRQTANLLLLAAFCWLEFGGGGLVFAPGPIAVLVVEETSERDKLTPAQREVVSSVAFRDYLKTHCSKDAAGNPDFRFVDKDDDMTQADPKFQAMFKEPRQSVPWIYIASGSSGFSGPVNDTTIATVKKWGGP